jgi:hypothetical protein
MHMLSPSLCMCCHLHRACVVRRVIAFIARVPLASSHTRVPSIVLLSLSPPGSYADAVTIAADLAGSSLVGGLGVDLVAVSVGGLGLVVAAKAVGGSVVLFIEDRESVTHKPSSAESLHLT